MSEVNNQFEHGRLPLRPLAYKNKDLAVTDELIIDYGKSGDEKFHIYITDSNDPKVLIDLSDIIANKVIPQTKFNANKFEVNIEEKDAPISLEEILNMIYKKVLYPSSLLNFNFANDKSELLNQDNLSSLLKDNGNRIILPVTLADNVFFRDGKTIEDKVSQSTKFAINRINIPVENPSVKQYQFEYPHEDYGDDVEIRIKDTYLSKTDYTITPMMNGEHFSAGYITLSDSVNLDGVSKIDVIFMYNSKAYVDGKSRYMDGNMLSIRSIPTNRLEKVSSKFNLNSDDTIATSKALYELYNNIITNMGNNANNSSYFTDYGSVNRIQFNSKDDFLLKDNFLCNVLLSNEKDFDVKVAVRVGSSTTDNIYSIEDPSGNYLSRGLPAGKYIQLLWVRAKGKFVINSLNVNNIRSSKFVYKSKRSDKTISYEKMQYSVGSHITVYRNGRRLFEDVDYSMDYAAQTITLFDRTEEGEIIIFEALYL